MNEHCNILILSVTAGNGHNSAAAALKEEFDRQGVNCHIMDLFQYLSPFGWHGKLATGSLYMIRPLKFRHA